ncbi:hypothetical protein [Dolichospermum sp. LEGE 00240]|nr:hypothetical protein [Dolichospermum sp. LEGE 00240]
MIAQRDVSHGLGVRSREEELEEEKNSLESILVWLHLSISTLIG